MSKHLSVDQFARCFVGQATPAELQHSRECPECGAELNRFGESVTLFQRVVHDQIDHRMTLQSAPLLKSSGPGISKQRWALIAAVAAVLVVLPFIRTGNNPEEVEESIATAADPVAVMNRVNLHLSRTVPSPMEPLLLGLREINP